MWIKSEKGYIFNVTQAQAVKLVASSDAPGFQDVVMVFDSSHAMGTVRLTRRAVADKSGQRIIAKILEAIVGEQAVLDMVDVIHEVSHELRGTGEQEPPAQHG